MDAYGGLAEVYDLFMDNVPYESWSRELIRILREYGVLDGLVLDLGCGTGKMTRLLARAGYDMIGIDASEEMLGVAKEREAEDSGILYLHQDMREFELYGTVRAVVCVCDALNYMLTETELQSVFSLVNMYLDPGGMFLFDLNTLYKYREILGERAICENREEGSFIWENYFDEETGINEYDLTLFIRGENKQDSLFQRFEETHYQRAYSVEEIKKALEEAGLAFEICYDAFTREPPRQNSERIYVIAREKGKKQL